MWRRIRFVVVVGMGRNIMRRRVNASVRVDMWRGMGRVWNVHKGILCLKEIATSLRRHQTSHQPIQPFYKPHLQQFHNSLNAHHPLHTTTLKNRANVNPQHITTNLLANVSNVNKTSSTILKLNNANV